MEQNLLMKIFVLVINQLDGFQWQSKVHRESNYLLFLLSYGKDTNGSQWFVTLVPARWLDGHHVVFGRVLQGIDFIHEIGEVDTFPGTSLPKKYVGIVNGSAKEVIKRYDLALEDLVSIEDIIVA
jgi:cyclophilin family peptidyl-prolyl cis-trans isomerase